METVIRLRSAVGVLGIISVLCICSADGYTPADNYLISCGSSLATPVGRRLFLPDDSGEVTLTSPQSTAVKAPPEAVSGFDNAAVYQTARVFMAPSSYSFRIRAPGRHFLRLHFFPFAYQGLDLAAAASFKVSTQDAVLIDSFPGRNASASASPAAACEEFLLAVTRDALVVTFVPLDGGVAFVNAVEVVSVPDGLVASSAKTLSSAAGQQLIPAVLPLQTIYRVNVGGPAVAADNDTFWREWTTDERLLIGIATTVEVTYGGRLNYLAGAGAGMATPNDAPEIVYATARELIRSNWLDTSMQMTWNFAVDAPSSYLIRIHLCDIVSKTPHLVHIDAFIGSYTAMKDFDLSAVANGALAFPYHTDFVLDFANLNGKLQISFGSKSMYDNKSTGPFLNGLEIMKIRQSGGDVVVVEPAAGGGKPHLAVVLGSVCGALALVSLAAVLVVILRKKKRDNELPTPTPSQPSTPWMPLLGRFSFRSPGASARASRSPSFTLATNTPRASPAATAATAASSAQSYRFPFATLQEATNNFDESLVVGVGGFGKVYAAVLPDGTKVAAKRASPESRQGAREFRTEIELLSGLRHRHLVSLIGYCDEQDEMILLYEYMEHGSLRSRLYGGGAPEQRALSWAQRLEACVGAARGLLYLHTAVSKPVIHRDVKSSNILLDGGLTAKVADFGLSKAGPELDETHVSTAVKGSFGYVDPDYARTRKLTSKSDVYSFGVVLLEALCARPVVDPRLPRPMANLVEWGLHWQGRGELGKVVDRRIAGEVRPAALSKFGETAARCLAERGADRPAMEDVVWSLQFVMRLQGTDGLDFSSDVSSLNMVRELTPPAPPYARQGSAVGSDAGTEGEGESIADGDFYSDVSMRGVFWKMVNVRGR